MPSSNNNDEASSKDGIMDRLARALFASPSSPLTAFADRQRVERLEQCRQFERIVEACQSAARYKSDVVDEQQRRSFAPSDDVPTSRSGERISRFFGWGPHSSDQKKGGSVLDEAASSIYDREKDTEEVGEITNILVKKEQKVRPRFSEGCAIETHELWACRALAVGCGNILAELRQCWSDAERKSLVASKTEEGMEFYNDKSNDKSCRSIQLKMARCVNDNSSELHERIKSVEQAKKM